ncbi:DEAD/DEAH box helicase [Phosphitispora sp. TUW77]|uniref:DEAD/DEAH box helicase n=1 Tax=Phosphitispora sp. TUW77 TaxID=3152361 RepID=UPI003AB6DCC1
MRTFYELGLSQTITQAITEMGFETTTPIQEQTIVPALTGRDIIGQAQTGTGKTAAFGIPLVEKADIENQHINGLVVAPTRELAIQVAEEINKIGQHKGVRALPIYGGQDITRQIRALKNRPQIIVGTPGRLMDHMRRKTIRLQNVSMVVLDEADEMLNMGFIEDIETILKEVPKERQTLLFSATMPKAIENLARQFMINPKHVSIETKEVTVPNTEQNYIEVQEKQKFDVLCRLLDIQSSQRVIIFGRTKKRVDEISEGLNKRGYSAEGIHGDLNQGKRDSVIRNFKKSVTEILVATDVAARGLDITDITHVYNFDIPQDPESYVHRIGRTGRAGKSGIAVTFVTPREMNHLRLIEQITKRRIVRKPIPTVNEALESQQQLAVNKLKHTIDQGGIRPYKELAESLLEDNDSVTLLSAALKLLSKEPDATPVTLTEPVPLRQKKQSYDKRDDRRGPKASYARGERNRSSRSHSKRPKRTKKIS